MWLALCLLPEDYFNLRPDSLVNHPKSTYKEMLHIHDHQAECGRERAGGR